MLGVTVDKDGHIAFALRPLSAPDACLEALGGRIIAAILGRIEPDVATIGSL